MNSNKEKSQRNKTIDFSLEEGDAFFKRCLQLDSLSSTDSMVNRTINGDVFQVLPLLPKASVDLLIVDPPYNLDKDFHGNKFSKQKDGAYQQYTEKWVDAVLRVLKPTASIYVCCDWKTSLVIGGVLEKHLHIRNRITWQREKGRGAKANWKNGMEDIWFATVSDEYIFNIDAVKTRKKVVAPYRVDGKPKDWEETPEGNFRNTHPSNFWDDISIPYWSMSENTAHPTQKPEKLIAKLILASSNPGDVILDPFLGSGTTSVVAKKLERDYIGIEQNELYCAWAEYRLEQANTDKSIQGYSDGVFWERNMLSAINAQQKEDVISRNSKPRRNIQNNGQITLDVVSV
jgi:site-specific DNA-methyltransferase (adenine-specific)